MAYGYHILERLRHSASTILPSKVKVKTRKKVSWNHERVLHSGCRQIQHAPGPGYSIPSDHITLESSGNLNLKHKLWKVLSITL